MLRWIVAAAVVGTGCGGGYAPVGVQAPAKNVVKVAGTLTFQGKPLANYMVSFIPAEGAHNAVGVTDSSGNFVLGTNKPGDGAAVGSYKVSVAFAGPPQDDSNQALAPAPEPDAVPKPAIEIPAKYTDPNTSEITVEVPSGGLTDYKIELK